MSRTQVKTTSKKQSKKSPAFREGYQFMQKMLNAQQARANQYLEGVDSSGADFKLMAALVYLMLENPGTHDKAKEYLEKWAELCATDADAIEDILGSGLAGDLPLMGSLWATHGQIQDMKKRNVI